MTDQANCERCGKPTPLTVFCDTAGICRSCQKSLSKSVTLADLARVLRGKDKRYMGIYFDEYRKRKPSVDAVPILQEALRLNDYYVSRCAAIALGKLGAKARLAIPQLLDAADFVDEHGIPQAFPECIESIVRMDSSCQGLIPLIKKYSQIENWLPISASLRVLARIGTPEATQLFREIYDKWYNDFTKTQKRIADELLQDVLSAEMHRGKQ